MEICDDCNEFFDPLKNLHEVNIKSNNEIVYVVVCDECLKKRKEKGEVLEY